MYNNLCLLGQWLKISLFSLFLLSVMAACGTGNGTGNQSFSLPTATSSLTTGTGFKVSSVDMSANPATIAGISCGTNLTVTYTATFHVTPNSPGWYRVLNTPSTMGVRRLQGVSPFAAVRRQRAFNFTWSGSLPADHTYPGLGGVMVTSPNQLTSPTVKPDGSCTTQDATFNVTSIDMSVNPTSIQGNACGTYLTVTYTATFHVTPNSPGGVVQFEYTVNNGRGE